MGQSRPAQGTVHRLRQFRLVSRQQRGDQRRGTIRKSSVHAVLQRPTEQGGPAAHRSLFRPFRRPFLPAAADEEYPFGIIVAGSLPRHSVCHTEGGGHCQPVARPQTHGLFPIQIEQGLDRTSIVPIDLRHNRSVVAVLLRPIGNQSRNRRLCAVQPQRRYPYQSAVYSRPTQARRQTEADQQRPQTGFAPKEQSGQGCQTTARPRRHQYGFRQQINRQKHRAGKGGGKPGQLTHRASQPGSG